MSPYTIKPIKSPAEDNEPLAEDVDGDNKDGLRRAVESLFNNLYGMMYQLRLRDTHELILWALIFIVLKSSLIVFCIEWSGYHLQSTV